jgi:murein DD-endopeptidase MepM/ murein hydrolase activator NlpD
MIDLIKSLFRRRDRDLIVMIIDPADVGKQDELKLSGRSQSRWFTTIIFGSGLFVFLFLVLLILRWTAGGDARIRMELNQLAIRVNSLSDSVLVRDQQLQQIRSTIAGGEQSSSDFNVPISVDNNIVSGQNQQYAQPQDVANIVFPADWSRVTRNMAIRPRIRGGVEGDTRISSIMVRLPISGRITRPYMPAIGHYGTDIAVREGTVLRNVEVGTVIASDWTIPYGYVVTIIHEDGHVLVYKHLITSTVQSGEVLQKGVQIGIVGMAGTLSSGPHLHIELWKNGSHIDPMSYFIE